MSRPTFDELVASNIVVAFDDDAIEGLNRNLQALNGLAWLCAAVHQSPDPDELYALLNLIRNEQKRLLESGVQKPQGGSRKSGPRIVA